MKIYASRVVLKSAYYVKMPLKLIRLRTVTVRNIILKIKSIINPVMFIECYEKDSTELYM